MFIYLIYLFFFLVNGKSQNSIEFKIEISENFPSISIDIGNQKSRKLLISLYTPMILTFPYQNNSNHYDNTNSSTYYLSNIVFQLPNIIHGKENYTVMLSNEYFTINNNLNISLKFGVIINKNLKFPNLFAGVFGLIRGTEGFLNLENKYLLMNQLYQQNKISEKLFYMSPCCENNILLSESKIILGSYPSELKLNELPYCDLDNTYSKNYFDCRLDEIIIDDLNNSTRIELYKGRHIVARFEEGNIQHNQLPYFLYPKFKEIFVTQKGCEEINGLFDCSKNPEVIQNFKVSYVFGKYKYLMNTDSKWNKNKFFLNFRKKIMILLFYYLALFQAIFIEFIVWMTKEFIFQELIII